MTEEEMQAKLAETQAELASVREENGKLEKNQSNQNAYITKLEEKATTLADQISSIKGSLDKPMLDPNITKYLKKKYVEDFVKEGKDLIKQRDTKNVFPKLEAELDSFIKAYMNEDNASIKFILDSYSLILGRAYEDPTHAINTVEPEVKDIVQPIPAETKKEMPLFPPSITDADQGAGNPIAKATVIIPDTKTAFKVLEDKLYEQGRNKFE